MREVTVACLVAGLGLSLAAASPAAAQSASAYLLVEPAAGSGSGAPVEALRSLSLMNCLQLVESLVPGEAVVHLGCNDRASLNQAIGEFAEADGVGRITIWTVGGGG